MTQEITGKCIKCSYPITYLEGDSDAWSKYCSEHRDEALIAEGWRYGVDGVLMSPNAQVHQANFDSGVYNY